MSDQTLVLMLIVFILGAALYVGTMPDDPFQDKEYE